MKQERAVRTRNGLIRSAAEVFDDMGYAAARQAVICQRAGVSLGALHFHFENTGTLAAQVEQEAAAIFRALLPPPGSRGSGSHLQTLVDTSHTLVAGLGSDVVLRAGFRLNNDATFPREPGRPDFRAEWEQCVQRLLEEAERARELVPGVAPHQAVTAIVAITTGVEILGRDSRGWLSPYRLTGLWTFLLGGLAAEDVAPHLHPDGRHPAALPADRPAPGPAVRRTGSPVRLRDRPEPPASCHTCLHPSSESDVA
ncbi:ScbR family autoregulator-binding transcription factor [Streptomyces alanosinicus]|uniref:TetR family transcriptional regulator n=1 Tax=Streptomyces alanosinicus TaxID=68171 RepID=A0A918YTM7_9ACTN|nr:ScbR family autoregulator-binding transcription factor [Streptomyces alanosinicus]GHE15599.1 TetR family transcriptional regulator [Streptomyces alanosinicus]